MQSPREQTKDADLTTLGSEQPTTDPPSASQLLVSTGLPDMAGKILFDRYRVDRELGRGGMGRVLLAFDIKLQLNVALKLIPEQLVPDRESINDLRQEVHRGMALTHPGIVRTHTFELDGTGAAVVMEFVDGETLADLREAQPCRCFDVDQLLPWIAPLCEIVDYAHREARIVHRDLKPRNIMLTKDGRIKVADFGIAATLTDTYTRNTGEARHSGTPPYMSPQQAEGRRPEPSDDIYSLGATLYDLLTGKPPFFRGPHHAIIMQVRSIVPPTIAERREELGVTDKAPIPPAWEDVIAACLAKDPAHRPQSAAMVLARLRGEQSGAESPHPGARGSTSAARTPGASPAVGERTSPSGRPHHVRTWLMLAVIALLGGATWWSVSTPRQVLEETDEYIPSVEDREALARARALLTQQKAAEADAVLARLPDGYAPGDLLKAEAAARLEAADRQAAEQRRAKVAELMAQSEAAFKNGDLEAARIPANAILENYAPAHPDALAALKRIETERKTTQDRDALKFTSIYTAAELALSKGEHDRVESLLGSLPEAYRASMAVEDLQKRLGLARLAAVEAQRGEQQRAQTKKRTPGSGTTSSARTSSRRPPPTPPKKPAESVTTPAKGTTKPLKPGTPRPHSFLTM